MPELPKPDLSEHEEEAVPLDDVLRKLLAAKPTHERAPPAKEKTTKVPSAKEGPRG